MRRLAVPFLLMLLPVAAFLALFAPATLDIGNPGWLIRGTDNGENALGLHAYLHDPAAGASLRTGLLNAPDGVPVLFTDSNPLIALAVRPFAPLLPADAQFVGPWILLCLALSTLFAWLLLRRHAPGAVALWCGVALLAFPPTLANRFIHANLMAHWTILAALWLFLDGRRNVQLRWWAPLIALTTLIHSYLLIMVGAIWATALARRLWRGGWHDAVAVVGQAAAILLLVAVLALWLGVGGDFAPAGNYGAFAMPLDALWNPANPSYSNFLPAIEQRQGRGFEGFQYLGLGGLLLLAAALVAEFARPASAPERALRQRLRWLAPALVALTLLAISNRPDVAGVKLIRFPLPQNAVDALDAVRASGRMFWPVAYTILLVSVVSVYRLSRGRAGLILAGLVALQVTDLTGMEQAIRATSAEAATRRTYRRTTDPRWTALIARSHDVAFMPGDVTADLALFQEVAWRATAAGRPVTSVYAARTPYATIARLNAEQAAFAQGEIVPGRLYVLLPGAPLPRAAAADAVTLDGVTVIAPATLPAVSSPPATAPAARLEYHFRRSPR